MSELKRDFKGIWIPRDIWLSEELTLQEKIFLVEIDSLDNSEGCYAKNSHFASFFKLSKNRCSEIIKSLEKKGFVRIRYIRNQDDMSVERRVVNVVGKSLTPSESRLTPSESRLTPSRKCEESNTVNNTNKRTGGASSDFKELSKTYQQVIGQPNGYTAQWVSELLEAYGFEWSKEAMVAAEKQGKRSKAYVEAILQRWKTGGGMQKAGDKKPAIKEDRRAKESLWGKYSDLMANY